jgi:uncharacterized protein YecE (DUF72 family)
MIGKLLIGTSSFSEADWIGPFYPSGTKPVNYLTYYASQFPTVEIDATYYAVPAKSVVESWRQRTPEDFIFAAKFPRTIVHGGAAAKPERGTILVPEKCASERDRFLESMAVLDNRLGPLILQFPYFSKEVFASSSEFFDRLDIFLGTLPKGFRFAVEIRNRHWLNGTFIALLKSHQTALVLVDQSWMPLGDEVMSRHDIFTGGFVYIRLLGDRNEIEAITKRWDKEVIDRSDRLNRWADLAALTLSQGFETSIYTNNHYTGYAPAAAIRLRDMITSRLEKLQRK